MRSYWVVFLILFSLIASGQDIILTKDSTVYKCASYSVETEIVRCQLLEGEEAKQKRIEKDSVFMITDTDGNILVYPSAAEMSDNEFLRAHLSLYDIGSTHADKFYDQYTDAQWATFATTLVFSPAGLILAIITSSITPSAANLGYPNSTLWKNREYKMGYKKQAKDTKKYKVWDKFGLGVGINLTIGALVYFLSGR